MTHSNFFDSNGNLLTYSCNIPSENKKKIGVLFVHAASGNRFGPHRMFVEMSRLYAKMGYSTFRFDIRGCGDSTGQYHEYEIDPDVIDTLSAVRFFAEHANLEKVVLVGISKGARVCFTIMSRYQVPLAGMILLSTSVINNKSALSYSYEQLRTYRQKLFQLSSIKKILKGNINLKQIIKTLCWSIHISRKQKTQSEKVINSKCPTLLIYGNKDPIFKASYEYYSHMCVEHEITHKCHIIQGANHSFYHYKWKEEIQKVSGEWLSQIN